LDIDENGRGKGTIIEVKEEKGLGTTLDVIIYDGVMRKNDEIAYMSTNGIKRTKIRGLLEPNLSGKDKFTFLDEVAAAAGVKIYAPDLDGAIPGSPLEVVEDFERDSRDIEAQFKSVIFQKSDEAGVVLRADSLGSVEALLKLLKDAGIPVKDAAVGTITRKDVMAATVGTEEDKFLKVVLGFNVKILDEAWEESRGTNTPIIYSDIIYRLVDGYNEWVKNEKDRMKKEAIEKTTWPGRIKVLEGYVFRASKPAIFGVTVLAGRIRKGYRLMNASGEVVGEIREIQKEKEKVEEAGTGDQLAISCDGIMMGKNANEGDVLYTYMTLDEIRRWETRLTMLNDEEKALFEQIRRMLTITF
ncbi:MAG: EF-Tu/IF-2/RF-3 family GTPase, partial [Candidatus ainarchaeum sp.]|nr:EF-Tu/IF-2/RF-3 family GTPase [Candidatus ainarchaeum sp.]